MAQHAYWKGYLKLSLSCPSDHQLDGRLAEQHQDERKKPAAASTGAGRPAKKRTADAWELN